MVLENAGIIPGEAVRERQRLETLLTRTPDDGDALVELGRLQALQGDGEAAEATLKRAVELDPNSVPAYQQLATLYMARGDQAAILAVTKASLARFPAWNQQKLAALESGRAAMRRTQRSYLEVLRLLRLRGVRLVAVQYPVRNPDLLRAILGPAPDVLVVDNGRIFKRALERAPYSHYFIDGFGGDFGHTTPVGSRLLARNVARAILKDIR